VIRLLIWLVLITMVVVAVVMILRPSRARVTRIEHRREDEEKDGDDA
jgi:preprotein translocase subunit YajC